MKKKIRIALGSVLLILFFVVIASNIQSNYLIESKENVVILSSDRDIMANTPEELIENSELIVIAKVKGRKENKLFYDPIDDTVLSGHTVTTIKVKQVLKGTLEEKEITLVEGYYMEDETMYAYEDYVPLNDTDEYLLFLNTAQEDYFKGKYYIVEFDYGKYKVKSLDKDSKVALSSYVDQDLYNKKEKNRYSDWYNYVNEYFENK